MQHWIETKSFKTAFTVETIVGGTITTAEIYIVYMKESLFNRVL